MRGVVAVVVALLVVPGFVQAQSGASLVQTVQIGDAQLGATLIALPAKVGFIDADNDGSIDGAAPQEPVYLDIAGDGRVSYGDMRLTRFGDYAPGTIVDVPNRDFGHNLGTPSGWFGAIQGQIATFDADFSGTVSAGDIRLDGTHVLAGDADIGTTSTIIQGTTGSSQRVGFVDDNANGRRDRGENVFLDMDESTPGGSRKVSQGDIRFAIAGFGVEDSVSRAEFDALRTAAPGTDGGVAPDNRVTDFDWLLVSLAVVNLLGLAYVVRAISKKPKNPFK